MNPLRRIVQRFRGPDEYGGHTPKTITPNPKATTVPKGPAPGATRRT